LQWDIWSDSAEDDAAQAISYAHNDPVKAACELLSHRWRPDLEYEAEEDV
jgi:hypothetical protein